MSRNGIWREGGRIRATDGMGYHDRVPDETLAEWAADVTLSEYDRAFAAAVLAIRRFERADPRAFATQPADQPQGPQAEAVVGS
jgi:lysozyme family protein